MQFNGTYLREFKVYLGKCHNVYTLVHISSKAEFPDVDYFQLKT